MRFVLVRHAQSEANRLWAETGTADAAGADPGLSRLGVRQARALARDIHRLPWRPTHLYASRTARAAATAAPLAAALGLGVVTHDLLHEVAEPAIDPREGAPDAAARAGRLLASLRTAHAPDDVAVLVTHLRFGQEVLRALVGHPADVWVTLHHTGVSALADARAGLPSRLEVHGLDDTSHLPPAWRTG